MKILQVLPALGSGGAEHFTVGLINELIHQGYECDVVTLFDIDKDNDLLKELSSKSHHSSLHKKLGFDFGCYYRLYKFIKRGAMMWFTPMWDPFLTYSYPQYFSGR